MESNIDGEKSVWETTGTYEKQDSYHFITYIDYAGNTVTNNELKIKEDMAQLTRRGASSCDMLFQADKKHKTFYQVMAGNMEFDVYTREYVMTSHENRLELFIDYFLENESRNPIHNFMKIQLEVLE